MRIVHVTGMQSKKFGSLEEYFVALAAECQRRGHSLTIVYSEPPASRAYVGELARLGAAVEAFDGSPRQWLALAAMIRRARPDVIHTHFGRLPYPFLAAGTLAAKKIYWTKHNLLQAGANPFGPALWLHRALARRACRVYCVSEAIRRELEEKRIRCHGETRYLGINIERYSPRGAERAATLAGADVAGKRVVTCIALAIPAKGVEYFVRAIPHLVDTRGDLRFLHVGGGALQPALEELAATLGVREQIQFLGVRNDIEAVLASSDVTVLPSLSEGLGLAILESMAAGKPVVASAVGGIPEVLVDGKHGLLVPPGDPVALAAAIGRVVDDAALRTRLGAQARAHALAQFDVHQSVARLVDDYERDASGPTAQSAAA